MSKHDPQARKRRILIVGGVAGGASTAARLRRLDESAEIVVFDRGPYVSFANCGLPYFVGRVIAEEQKLHLASRELFRDRFNIDVRTEHEVLKIDRAARTIRVEDKKSGEQSDQAYDVLVLATGAGPILPNVPGVQLPGVFVVRTIPDSRRIRAWLDDSAKKEAVVVGGGFIGLEMAENLAHRGLRVTVLEKLRQVMPPIDPEMATFVQEHLEKNNVRLRLGEGLTGIEQSGGKLRVSTDRAAVIETDLVILSIGVRPEVSLARDAGLVIGERGGVVVDKELRTSDPAIYAVGDAVQVHETSTGQEIILPLAGPANREGRIAAEAIAGRTTRFRGVQGTAIVSVFDLTVASTGASEKGLARAGQKDFGVVYLHPGHHAGYFPGAKPIHLKLIFDKQSGLVLGAQAIGFEGTDKRIDVIAAMIQLRGTVFDLAEAELCYAPQFGAAKDPVNLAGMLAANVIRGDMQLADWRELPSADVLLFDVREPDEYAAGHIKGAINVPLSILRQRARVFPNDRPVWIYCAAGQRGYFAQRFLSQNGFEAKNLSGGYITYRAFRAAGLIEEAARSAA